MGGPKTTYPWYSQYFSTLLYACLLVSLVIMGIVQYGKVSLALSNKLNTLNIQSHATRPYIIASVLVWQTFVFLSCTTPNTN